MAISQEFMDFVAGQVMNLQLGEVRTKKMFGGGMLYLNSKPILLLMDGVVLVKKVETIAEFMTEAECAPPYEGAKEHYILDIEDMELLSKVIPPLEAATALPKPRKPKAKAKAKE